MWPWNSANSKMQFLCLIFIKKCMTDAMVSLSINNSRTPGMITSTVKHFSRWLVHTSFSSLSLAVCDMKQYTSHSSMTASDDWHSFKYTCMCSWILIDYAKRSCGSVLCIFAIINCNHQQLNVGCCSRSTAFKIMGFCSYAQH
jgi:hypothetical protein